jgi:hypothetical protein
MYKKVSVLLIIVMLMFIVAGCSSKTDYGFETNESLVYVQSKDSIISIFIEKFDKKKYDKKELKKAIEDEVSDYNKSASSKDAMSLVNLEIKKSVATLELKYKTPADYSAYNTQYVYYGTQIQMLIDSISNLAAQGISFDGEFNKIGEDDKVSVATQDQFKDKDNLTVVLLTEGTNVRVNGDIKYTSKNVTVKDGVAKTTAGENNYIIYKQKEVK